MKLRNILNWIIPLSFLLAACNPANKKETGKLIQITQGENDCVQFYFNQSPENPSGTKVVYSLFTNDSTAVYTCNTDGTNHKHIGTVPGINRHMGAKAHWISDKLIVYHDGENCRLHFYNVNEKTESVYTGDIDEYSPKNNKIIFCSKNKDTTVLESGIYEFDLDTRESRQLIDMDRMKSFSDTMEQKFEPEIWRFDHAYWSPDNQKIMFQIKADKGSNPEGDFIFYASADGSGVQYIGPKMMHVQWWDNSTVFGHDWQQKKDKYMRRWNLHYEVVETVCGSGNHGCPSPNKELIATETWYGSDPIRLRLYKRGNSEPSEIIYEQTRNVAGRDFWEIHSHMHPSWSRDGSRVYFNAMPEKDGVSQLFAYDVPEKLLE